MSILRLLRTDRRGNAAVEFALGLPILLLATLMVVDIGRALLAYTSVHNLAAEGVRYASVRGPDSPTSVGAAEIQSFVVSRAAGINKADLSVAVAYDDSDVTGNAVIVTVNYNMHLFLNPMFAFADFTISGESRMTML